MKRGLKKTESKLVNVWLPKTFVPMLDVAVKNEDTDRSKFIRSAIRDKMRRGGFVLPETAQLEKGDHQ